MVHVHQGKIGENCSVAVTHNISKILTNGPVNRQLVRGDISTSKIEGRLKGIQISNMTKLMEVTMHT
jgi:hypothetical protein